MNSLTQAEMQDIMTTVMDGQMPEQDITNLLLAMKARGETVDEITGAALALRQKAITLQAPIDAIDCCGTGGDMSGTYNISTAVAFVAASCGIPIAKHGGGASTSKSGSVDVIAALGINFDASPQKLEEALQRFNFAFMAAPRHHKAMKSVREIRKKIGTHTIFNLLGPLANPAGTKYQLIGVYDKKWLRPLTQVLHRLGTKRAWLVHGNDGLDEITTTDKTYIAKLHEDGSIEELTVKPQDFGLPTANSKDLSGGDAEENAAALMTLLQGSKTPYRDIVLANTAAVLCIHSGNDDLKEAVQIAAQAIDQGKALDVFESYRNFTQTEQKP